MLTDSKWLIPIIKGIRLDLIDNGSIGITTNGLEIDIVIAELMKVVNELKILKESSKTKSISIY